MTCCLAAVLVCNTDAFKNVSKGYKVGETVSLGVVSLETLAFLPFFLYLSKRLLFTD